MTRPSPDPPSEFYWSIVTGTIMRVRRYDILTGSPISSDVRWLLDVRDRARVIHRTSSWYYSDLQEKRIHSSHSPRRFILFHRGTSWHN